MGKKDRKIPVSDFISDKKLERIMKFIESAESTEDVYDRIESLLEDDFEVKDLGTNRIVLKSKKSKYKDLIFKVAGDSHGIEANFREFYNGDLDKRLTFSYSISKNGVFVVQEKVKPFTSKDMEEYKKDVREMLTHLSKKLLLVDCKVKNFKNFGLRSNGDVCLLDHGDTVPLPEYQGDKIINVNEESYVSLRCKGFKDPGETRSTKIKPCGGKLKYSKNFDYLECEKCGTRITVNDAYKEFYGDARISATGKNTSIDVDESFYQWRDKIREYCVQTMDEVENNSSNNQEEETIMVEKIIGGEKCIQLKGYWVPEHLTKGVYAMNYSAAKCGNLAVAKLLEIGKLNPKDYVVTKDDHMARKAEIAEVAAIRSNTNPTNPVAVTSTKRPKPDPNTRKSFDEFASDALTIAKEDIGNNAYVFVMFEDVFGKTDPVDWLVKNVWFRIRDCEDVERARYDIPNHRYQIEFKKNSRPKKPEPAAKVEKVEEKPKKKKMTNDEWILSQPQFLVNGVCCIIIGEYYVPCELALFGMNKDAIKTALKADGYQPKKFRTDNPEVFATRVNTKNIATDDDDDEVPESVKQIVDEYMEEVGTDPEEDDDDKFVCSESDDDVEDLSDRFNRFMEENSDSDTDTSGYEDDDDEDETEPTPVEVDEEPIDERDAELMRITKSKRADNITSAVEKYRQTYREAMKFIQAIESDGEASADRKVAFVNKIKYGPNGCCNLKVSDAVDMVNNLLPVTAKESAIQFTIADRAYDTCNLIAQIIENAFGLTVSVYSDTESASHGIEIISKVYEAAERFIRDHKETFDPETGLDYILSGRGCDIMDVCRSAAPWAQEDEFNKYCDIHEDYEYDAMSVVSDLLNTLYCMGMNEDLEEDYKDEEGLIDVKKLCELATPIYKQFVTMVHHYAKEFGILNTIPTYDELGTFVEQYDHARANVYHYGMEVLNGLIKKIYEAFADVDWERFCNITYFAADCIPAMTDLWNGTHDRAQNQPNDTTLAFKCMFEIISEFNNNMEAVESEGAEPCMDEPEIDWADRSQDEIRGRIKDLQSHRADIDKEIERLSGYLK